MMHGKNYERIMIKILIAHLMKLNATKDKEEDKPS